MKLTPEELAGAVLEALSDADVERLRGLVSPDVVFETGRTTLQGIDAAAEWVSKRYDHLERSYVAEHTEIDDDGGVVVSGLTRFEWRDEPDEPAQETPVCFEMSFEDGLLTRLFRRE